MDRSGEGDKGEVEYMKKKKKKKKYLVCLVRAVSWIVEVEAEDRDDAEFMVLEKDTSELMHGCESCEVTDILCNAEKK